MFDSRWRLIAGNGWQDGLCELGIEMRLRGIGALGLWALGIVGFKNGVAGYRLGRDGRVITYKESNTRQMLDEVVGSSL